MKRQKTYDPKSYELAEYFLEGGSPELNCASVRHALAVTIQEAIEGFLQGAEDELADELPDPIGMSR